MDSFFPFLQEKGHAVSLVGSGGKTTLMYAMARRAAELGCNVLVSTTTHIVQPKEYVWTNDASTLSQIWQIQNIAVMGRRCEDGKLEMSSVADMIEGMERAGLTLLESDAARRMPCKMPGSREPILIPVSDIVVAVVGMDALGKTLEEACFRSELAMELLGVPADHRITEEDIACMASSEQGLRKNVDQRDYYVVLNKCDTEDLRMRAWKIRELLLEQGISGVVLSTFDETCR